MADTQVLEVPEVELQEWQTSSMSPYKFARLMSEVVGKEIQPQRVYGDIGRGALKVGESELGHKVLAPEHGNEYIRNYLQRQLEREAKAAAKAAESNTDEATTDEVEELVNEETETS